MKTMNIRFSNDQAKKIRLLAVENDTSVTDIVVSGVIHTIGKTMEGKTILHDAKKLTEWKRGERDKKKTSKET